MLSLLFNKLAASNIVLKSSALEMFQEYIAINFLLYSEDSLIIFEGYTRAAVNFSEKGIRF